MITCKQLVLELHEYIWVIFWLSIAVHVFLGVFIPIMREFAATLRASFRQNFQDHEDLGRMIQHKNKNTEQ